MVTLADTRTLPIETAAAIYEANGAAADFMRAFIREGNPLSAVEWIRDYRDAAETIMDRCFAALRNA